MYVIRHWKNITNTPRCSLVEKSLAVPRLGFTVLDEEAIF